MRQREQDQVSAEVRRELEALDRALAGQPVDAEFDGVATLARELRAARPEPPDAFATRLDERVAQGFPPEERSGSGVATRIGEWFAGIRPMRLLTTAGAAAAVVLVVSVAVIRNGDGGDVGGDATTLEEPAATQEQETADDAGRGGAAPDAAPAAPGEVEEFQLEEPVAPIEPGGNAGAEPDRIAPGADREVERSASLSLSADGDEFEEVVDGVVEVTDTYEGFVISSEESSSGETSRATFELQIPSDRLQPALADLSELGHVESRSEDALDITAPTVTARQRLTDARTEVEALLGQLAEAETPKETQEIRFRLDAARAEAASAKEEFQRLSRRANYATVAVTVSSDENGDGNWGVEEALDDIGDALSTAGGVALIAAAILLPVALIVAIVALAWRHSVRRGRERALDGPAE